MTGESALKMKVLFVQKTGGVSGSEKYLMNILPLLKEKGIETAFCCVQRRGDEEKNSAIISFFRDRSIPVHIIYYRFAFSLSIVSKLNSLIKREKYDIVQSNLVHADLWSALVKKIYNSRAKFIGVYHGFDEAILQDGGFDPQKIKKNAYYYISRFSSKQHDYCACISYGLEHFLLGAGIVPQGKLRVIQYGFDFSGVEHSENYLQYRYSDSQLVIVGRLVQYKQQHMVIEVFPELKKQFPNIKLVLVGDGEMKEQLQTRVKNLGLSDHVTFAGFVTNTHDYIAASDIMLVPSRSEGFGIVLLEGWHNKKPLVAFDVPAPNEIIISGENGFLIPPFDLHSLAEHIAKLLSQPQLAKRMGQNGYDRLNTQFTTQRMLENTIDMYNAVLQTKKVIA